MNSPGTSMAGAGQEPSTFPVNRRRSVRQKVHVPAYANIHHDSGGSPFDLSEILNISEDGMAIQSTVPLQVDRQVSISLDLSDIKAIIHTSGDVIWSKENGRAGIRFPKLPEDSSRQLRAWLFHNAMVACTNHAEAHVGGAPAREADALGEPSPPVSPDFTSVLIALQAVKREVDARGSNLDGALQLLADRAQSFTRATGAAIALADGSDTVCRATAGPDAPGLGVRLQVGSGFSGECVRTGRLLRCDDSEIDSRVDREICRALGIRSMVAVPVRVGGTVSGLLEVFSPRPRAFGENDDLVLQRLAETISAAVNRATHAESGRSASVTDSSAVGDDSPISEVAEDATPRYSRSSRLLLLLAALVLIGAIAWVFAPWIKNKVAPVPRPVHTLSAPPKAPLPPADFASLRKLAEQGDAAAQFAVGAHYATGEDVAQDYAEAMRWFSLAAEQGHVVAQQTLGAFYWAGRGVPQDIRKAYFWSILAQAGGDESSKYRAAILASRMTHSEAVAVQQQANEWLKQHQAQGEKPLPR